MSNANTLLRRSLLIALLSAVCGAASLSWGQEFEGAAPMEERAALAERVRSRWPARGSVFLRYANENSRNHLEVGLDFGTGAWFRVWQFQTVTGMTPGGGLYDGTASVTEPRTREKLRGASWLLDSVMPQLGLVEILEDERWPVRIEDLGGSWRVTAKVPRGSRMPVESLSAAEVERWGGESGMLRDIVFMLRDDLSIASRSGPTSHDALDPRTKVEEFDMAACSPGGFQVVQTHPPPGEMALIDCSFDPAGASGAFAVKSVVERAISRRLANPEVTPLVTAEQADADPAKPAPITGSRPAWAARTGLIAGGALLVLLGGAAWWRARRV